ncbi:armadillo-type protein [Mycena vitilis]|nr:armadillo-type protein [Mycena vitilis]
MTGFVHISPHFSLLDLLTRALSHALSLMQPLARQRSRSSILSWWSDSNPPGATINIHAIAKPLMRFMYHRQALDLIKSSTSGTLSNALLEAYSAYLSCKYVSPATKGAVLRELETLSRHDGPCTVIVGDEIALRQVVELAISADVAKTLRLEACGILGNVVVSPASTHAQRTELCRPLVSLLRETDLEIAAVVRGAVSSAASTLKAAESLIDADGLDYLSQLLASPDRHDRAEGRKLITNLASHDLGRTYGPRLCVWLVSFLRGLEHDVVEAATQALSLLAKSVEGAEMVINANALDYLAESLSSPDRYVWEWPWKLVMNLASHNLGPSYRSRLCGWLVSFLRIAEHDVVEAATHALSLVAKSLQGAKTVIEAEAANYLRQLLKSERAEIRTQTWVLMKQLASHERTAPTIFPLIMGGHNFDLPDGLPADAIYTLMNIAKWADGPGWHWNTIDREVLDGLSQLLESQQPLVCRFACAVAGEIAAHGHPAASAILGVPICVKLVSIMSNGPGTLTEAAIYALCRICRLQHGMQNVVEARTLENLWEMLDADLYRTSTITKLPAGYCELVQILACDSLASAAVNALPLARRIRLASLICPYSENTRTCLEKLLSAGDPKIRIYTWWLLLRLVDREAVDSPSFVRGFTTQRSEAENPSPRPATMLSRIAPGVDVASSEPRHILREILGSPTCSHSQRAELCRSLVSLLRYASLLRDKDIRIATASRGAVSSADSTLKAAEELIDNDVLDFLAKIIGSRNTYLQTWPRKLLTKVASHNSGHTYGPRLCMWLVSFLRVAEHNVVEAATHALSLLAESLQGAKMVTDANAADYLEQLLKSESTEVRRRTWELTRHLASHELTAPVIFPLVMRGCDFDLSDGLPADAIYTLMNLAKWFQGTDWRWDTFDKDVFDGIPELLTSQQPLVRRFACAVAGKIAAHGHPAAPTILGLQTCERLVSLMRNGPGTLTEAAIYALCRICRLQHGVLDAVEAKIVEQLWELLDPKLSALPAGYCELVQTLAYHSVTSPFIITLSSPLRIKFTSLLRGPDKSTRSSLRALLLSGDPEVQTWTWWLVLRLVDREAVENPSFVRGLTAQFPGPENPSNPSPSLATISLETAPSFNIGNNSEIRQHLIDLTKSSNAELQKWTEGLRKRLAHHEQL